MPQRWTHKPLPADQIEALSRSAGISPVLAELLLRHGLIEPAEAERFLQAALAGLGDPLQVPNVAAAAARLRTAIADGEQVVVLGDYDVDGVSSTALLVDILRRFGLSPRFVVPRRFEDGYGLSRSAIDRALAAGRPGLFIALDCGTNSIEEVAYLTSQGVDVIVIDHHRSKETTLTQGLLINPHVHPGDATGEERNLCTVGLVFKLAHGLLKLLRQENHPEAFRIKLRDQLDLVAMGTVADLVPLLGENRIMAKHGLGLLRHTRRPGLRALMDVAGLPPGQDITSVDISYRLGPRINASGRLADAALSVELLLNENAEFCATTAAQLDQFNRERQEIERQITRAAEAMIEERYADAPGIVLYGDDWHPGVVGIVAGQVARKYHRPCVVLGNEGALAKGSGRSIEGINLVEVLGACSAQLTSWGGHPMAVGVALQKNRLDAFREQFAATVRAYADAHPADRHLEIAAWLPAEQVGEELMNALEELRPFGQGNPEPLFGLGRISLPQAPDVFKGQHFRFWFEDALGRRHYGVAWKMAGRLPPVREAVDLAVKLHWNHFNGRKLLQLELIDWRPAESV